MKNEKEKIEGNNDNILICIYNLILFIDLYME